MLLVGLVDAGRFNQYAQGWAALPAVATVVDALWVRTAGMSADQARCWAERVRREASNARLWVDRDESIAAWVGAAAIHLGSRDAPAAEVRRRWEGKISASVHTVPEFWYHQAADWLIWGHAFFTRSKPGAPPRGFESLSAILQVARQPVLVVGGVSLQTLSQLQGWAIGGIVVGDGLWATSDPFDTAVRLCQGLDAMRTMRPKG
jgi:thiamine-phosphate diphosphorylase